MDNHPHYSPFDSLILLLLNLKKKMSYCNSNAVALSIKTSQPLPFIRPPAPDHYTPQTGYLLTRSDPGL